MIKYQNTENCCKHCRFSFKREDGALLCAKTINTTQPENWCKIFKMKR